MKILKASDPITIDHPVLTLSGLPGVCKTSLGYSAKNPLLLDFDKGAHRAANRRDTVQIQEWQDIEGLDRDTLAPYASIIVDTVGRCLGVLAVDIIDTTPKYGRGSNLTLQGYGELKSRFRAWLTQLRTWGKDVVLICHSKQEKSGDVTTYYPDITGGSYDEVMSVSDLLGFVHIVGKQRQIDFAPTEEYPGKDPCGWGTVKVPPITKAQNVLAELLDRARATLGGVSEASGKVAQQVLDWQAACDTLTTVDEVNNALRILRGVQSPLLGAPMKKLLEARATALKLHYHGDAKCFVEEVTA